MDIIYKIYWSDEIPDGAVDDFLAIENRVLYHGGFTKELFERKFRDNIYGPSLLILAYVDSRPVGVHVAWRNDIGGQRAYQGTDACLLPVKGAIIFPKMLMLVKEKVGDECPIYGFPNSKAFPVHRMMRHKVLAEYRSVWCFSLRQYAREEPLKIPASYARWWLAKTGTPLMSLRLLSHLYVVRIVKKKWGLTVLDIVGELEDDSINGAGIFPRYNNGLFLLSYKSRIPRWYNKNRFTEFRLMNYGAPVSHIPTWTVDAL